MEIRASEMEHEEKMARLHNEATTVENRDSVSNASAITKGIRSPPLPCFNEDKDSIDVYLQRFERYAENQGWERENYAIFLSALLSSHALEVYSRSPISVANDYDQ